MQGDNAQVCLIHTQTHYKCLFSSCSTVGAAAQCIISNTDSNIICHVKTIITVSPLTVWTVQKCVCLQKTTLNEL